MSKKKTNKKKKPIGRPKKNLLLNFNEVNKHNNNINNIWPINNLKTDCSLNKPHEKLSYLAYFKYNNSKIFSNILSIIKGRYIFIHFIFDQTGITFKHFSDNIMNDVSHFMGKILPDKLIDYRIRKNIEFKMELKELLKIFKCITPGNEFTFLIREKIHKNNTSLYLEIIYGDKINKSNNRYTSKIIKLNNPESNIKNNYKYDLIILMESAKFAKECESIKSFSNKFEIEYSGDDFIMQCNNDTNTSKYSCFIKENNKTTIFIKKYDKLISNQYILSSFIKYIKFSKISPMIKLYIKNLKPLIIEYDIPPGLGVIQVIICPQQQLSNNI
jgi:hypothetical protein